MEFVDHIASIFSDFTNPKKRVFVGYLFLSLLIALLWLIFIKRMAIGAAVRKFFDRGVFFSDSSQADYKIFLINRIFSFFVSPLLITHIVIATALFFWLHEIEWLRRGHFSDAPTWLVVALYSVFLFSIDDFTKYLVHRWMHKWPVLWAIHKTHHSATTLTPITVYRVHPLEGVLYAMRGAVAQGTAIALFVYLFGDKVDLYTIVGVNVLVFFFHVTGSNLRHSHINIRYWPWLERILISPAQHQLHHSVAEEHYDKNFGVALAVWDWIFGSLHLSESEEELTFGLDASEQSDHADLKSIYTQPFIEIWTISRDSIKSFLSAARKLAGLRWQ
ncbi:MAG: sterol desaturase family protein [Pseudomonadota bacterium]